MESDGALLLSVAVLGWMTGNLLEQGKDLRVRDRWEKNDLYSWANRLPDRPASDAEIWSYIAAKVYWSWHFGLTECRFDIADDLQLGLPRLQPHGDTGLPPGQIDRVAMPGMEEYWRVKSNHGYVPTHRLLQEFSGSSFWNPGDPYESLEHRKLS